MSEQIDIRPLARAMGAEVSGIDLADALGDNAVGAVRAALLAHKVLVFRGQDITPAQQQAFAACFGPLSEYRFAEGLPDAPNVIELVKNPEDDYAFGSVWHSDGAYLERPTMATLLFARELPPIGGDTLYANAAMAYDHLSDGMKAMLSKLHAVNSTRVRYEGTSRGSGIGARTSVKAKEGAESENTHPVVRTHPETGIKAIYVNAAHTSHFVGMTREESLPLLQFLYHHITRPEFLFRLEWQPGTLAMWDNRVVQHYAVNDYNGHRRVMHRVTLDGDVPA